MHSLREGSKKTNRKQWSNRPRPSSPPPPRKVKTMGVYAVTTVVPYVPCSVCAVYSTRAKALQALLDMYGNDRRAREVREGSGYPGKTRQRTDDEMRDHLATHIFKTTLDLSINDQMNENDLC